MTNTPPTFRAPAASVDSVIAALGARFESRLSTAPAVREQHGRGEGLHDLFPPDAVVYPETNEEVAFILATCNAARVPVVPFGTGTSLEGHVQARHGGICIDLSRMATILAVNPDDLDCRVQAGVTREQLNHHLRDMGLFFPLDPGANASLGGMAATRASGTNAVRYGTMREVTLGLTVVTPDGRIIHTGGRARKSSAGYDLTRLYIGSEGTLGVITEVQLRLFGIPEAILSAVCPFETLEGAVQAVTLVLQSGIAVARIELLDALQMRACIEHSKLENLAAVPTLFLEFHGSSDAVAAQAEQVRAITENFGGGDFQWARAQEERNRLWKARHEAYYAARSLHPGREVISTDACVPISRLAECIAETSAETQASGLLCPIVGHVGDGNFHVLIPYDPADPTEIARAEALSESISHRAIALGGTCTGEHGIGVHKLAAMRAEHGEAVDIMRTIKQSLDPNGIMNPGKTIPA